VQGVQGGGLHLSKSARPISRSALTAVKGQRGPHPIL